MKRTLFMLLLVLSLVSPTFAAEPKEAGFVPIFDGKTLNGWHVNSQTGHSSEAATSRAADGSWKTARSSAARTFPATAAS